MKDVEIYKQQIIDALAKIGWTLQHAGCDHWRFVNHKGKEQKIDFHKHTISLTASDYKIDFYMKDVEISEIKTNDVLVDGISFHGKSGDWMSLDCFNFDKKV